MSGTTEHHDAGRGLALTGLIIGLLTGAAVYGIVEFWIDGNDDRPLPFAVLFFVVTAAGSYLLLAETNKLVKSLGAALAIAAFFLWPDYFLASIASDESNRLTNFPIGFWFLAGRSIALFVMITLVKASLEQGAPPPYREVFFHGLTIPLIAGGAKVFAGLALVLLFAWARLLKEMDVNFFNRVFQEPWFIFPFLGAIGGLSVAMIRGQQAVLGALRFVLLLLARILIVITALFTVTLLIVIAIKGVGVVFDRPYPGAWMMGLALAGMLIFNGVYQNGEGGPPPLWLRLPALITLIGFPVYAWLAFYAFWLRIEDYGLTPMRITGVVMNAMIAAYSLICLTGLLTELNWRGRRWMPLAAPLNTAMAAVWIIVLTVMATPLVNPWKISAESQYAMIAEKRVRAEEFDFGFLRFELGHYGEAAFDKMLTLEDHPEAAAIRTGIEKARAAKNRWSYLNGEPGPAPGIDTPMDDSPPAVDEDDAPDDRRED